MDTADGLEFVNRGAELQFLKKCLAETKNNPALIVLRSPPGFGKSTLIDYFCQSELLSDHAFCVIDPSIRGKTGTVTLHDGFFIQKIAESLNLMASRTDCWISFSTFLKNNRKGLAETKDPIDVISELPTPGHIYKVLYDYISRIFTFDNYSIDNLLNSDEVSAVALCSAYAEQILKTKVLTIVVREVQHIDLQSLRTLLLVCENLPGPNCILEYTSEESRFEPEHQKLFLRAAHKHRDIKILDLLRLDAGHLEYLIHRSVRDDFNLTSDYYLSWDGNLRSILELKFQVGIGHALTEDTRIVQALSSLPEMLTGHLAVLSSVEKLVLGIVLAHVEPISLPVLSSLLRRIDPRLRQSEITNVLNQLESEHAFLAKSGSNYSVRDETIAYTLRQRHTLQAIIALAEREMRNHYGEVLEKQEFKISAFSDSVRHYFRLCARTKDVNGLLGATRLLSDQIGSANDQSYYIDVVASAIDADSGLYAGEHDNLINWAAELAYEASDWSKVNDLLSIKQRKSHYSDLLRACALQEIGGHNQSLELLAQIRCNNPETEVLLAADLIEALIFGCRGQNEEAREILKKIVENGTNQPNALIGYAYRFFEILDSFEEALKDVRKSIEWFESYQLPKSKAYSQLSAAMLLARTGDTNSARTLVLEASNALRNEVHDQHIILNNSSAIELLSDTPDFHLCCQQLNQALKFARDDFSELSILTNLSISHFGSHELEIASKCADKCGLILEDHDFADTNIYWPVCFNMMTIYHATNELGKAEAIQKCLPEERSIILSNDEQYWRFRFGEGKAAPDSHNFLLRKSWHPVYLSHWLIDLEGLKLLKPKQSQ